VSVEERDYELDMHIEPSQLPVRGNADWNYAEWIPVCLAVDTNYTMCIPI